MPLSLTILVGLWISSGPYTGMRVMDVKLDQPGPHEIRWVVVDFGGTVGRRVLGAEDQRYSAVPPGMQGGPDGGAWA